MEFFGFEIKRRADKINDIPLLDIEQNGSYVSTNAAATSYDFDFISSTEVDLINSYRRIAHIPEVASAIDKIINEMVILDDERDVVKLETSKLVDQKVISEELADTINDEFVQVCRLLDFNNTAHTKVRDWYIDSRIVFQKVINPSKPSDGVQRMVQLDPRKIKRIEIVDDLENGLLKIKDTFFVYMTSLFNSDMNNFNTQNIQMSLNDYEQFRRNVSFRVHPDTITYVDSGLVDRTSGISYGNMHRAVKIANQLDLVETALLIYRLSRSSERRAIYVDSGNLPPIKARELLEATKADFRNKVYYDSVRGTVEDKARIMSMQEDYFMLRRNGKSATQIETLQAGENLGQIEDVIYFREKLFTALSVPLSRFREDGGGLFSNKSEISRSELEFSEFVKRNRLQFSHVFLDVLRTNLILKRIIKPDDWPRIKDGLRIIFNRDNYFAELKEIEMLERRHAALDTVKEYIGVYYSNKHVRNTILQQTQEQMEEMDKQIKEEGSEYLDRNQPFPNEDTAKAQEIIDGEDEPIVTPYKRNPPKIETGKDEE
ncbi:portal vertex of the head [Agrobacterium phage OLIVR5]|uniref:Portal protein n=1 Tax=Agrobacterium phage OLIVR5 TaxID=2723773 RepID=A0A858MV53_9CAUD|nr:portal vertex of the head [Agrobacterium phage OLIVR5]QIW87840.1 portal vertex of the head [Agrobacterium phage OLIVR5]QIW88105.1 portal vertex of the head [Agrobacterium phage OLIVR6]